jgi:hypothetical protein
VIERAVQLWPKNLEALKNQCDLLITLKKYNEAMDCVSKILSLEPSNQHAIETKNSLEKIVKKK